MKSTALLDRAWLLATASLVVLWMMSTHAQAGAFAASAVSDTISSKLSGIALL